MAEFLAPDVYITEVQGKTGQVPEVSTSSFAVAGYSPRGPEHKPYVSSNFSEFSQRFGGFSKKSLNAYCVAAHFLNGGGRVWFVRALASDALLAKGYIAGQWEIDASGRGSWANDAQVVVEGNESFYDLVTGAFSRFNISTKVKNATTGDLDASESFEAVVMNDVDDPDYITKVMVNSEDVVFKELSGGIPQAMLPTTHAGILVGVGDGVAQLFSTSLSGMTEIAETTMKIFVGATQVATDSDGVITGTGVSGTIDYLTGALSVSISPAPGMSEQVSVDFIQRGARSITITLAGGADGSNVIASDVVGATLLSEQKGMYALDLVDEVLAISLPDFAGDADTEKAIITYADKRQDAIAVIQPPKGYKAQAAVKWRRNIVASQSSHAALYYPWINIPDPLNRNRPKLIPPCGHATGRYAYTDRNENVGKAPAGIIRGQLSFISSLELPLSKGDYDSLATAQINYIRSDANVGTAVWGNNTLQVVGDFTDVNVRRLFMVLAKEQYAGLLDQVFENVGPAQWTIIKTRLDGYLLNKFLGGVIGSGVETADQAFKVVVDETNNPPAVQQAKKIVIDEFIKPNEAAKFIHLRLQKVFDASQV